ncbi:hypothetical protein FJZ36_03510 [Candidatus Poribacteria bacterium]|nr:hypothetical protein [Candidatus Poribacteria bacterium]
MNGPIAQFDEHKEEIRNQLGRAIRGFQRLAQLDLADLTRENATEFYQEFAALEEEFEGIGGILDLLRHRLVLAGDSLTAQLEQIGFSGAPTPTVADQLDEDEAAPLNQR